MRVGRATRCGDDGWEQECHRQIQCGGHGAGSPIWDGDESGMARSTGQGWQMRSWYLLEVFRSDGPQMLCRWYTSDQTGCSGGTDCAVAPAGLNLANGDYKWRILDYGEYGYGTFTPFKTFTLNSACYSLTINGEPGRCSGTINASAPVQEGTRAGIGGASQSWCRRQAISSRTGVRMRVGRPTRSGDDEREQNRHRQLQRRGLAL